MLTVATRDDEPLISVGDPLVPGQCVYPYPDASRFTLSQAERLRALGWADYMKVDMARDRKSFVLSYWMFVPLLCVSGLALMKPSDEHHLRRYLDGLRLRRSFPCQAAQ